MGTSLVAFDTDRIKEYVFATGTLKEIRGASAILNGLHEVMRNLVGGRCYYAHGGAGLFVIPSEEVEQAINCVRQAYAEQTGGAATITGVALPLPDDFDETSSNIQALWKHLGYKLRAAKARNPDVRAAVTHPLLRYGDSDGIFYATEQERDEFISSPSSLKRRRNDAIHAIELKPKDFDAIAEASSPSGYFALIYADGDDLGRAMEECQTLADIQQFAQHIDTILQEACEYAIRKEKLLPHHFDILLSGGDDLLLAVPADKALSTALTIAEQFQNQTQQHFQRAHTISTAVVWAHRSFPFGAWLYITESALKFTKQAGALRTQHGLINFLVISSANHLDFKEFYTRVLYSEGDSEGNKTEVTRSLRPYTIDDLRRLIAYRTDLRKLTPTKLESLRRAVFQSSVQQAMFEALLVLTHWRNEEARATLLAFPSAFVSPVQDQRRQLPLMFPFAVTETLNDDPDERITTYATPIADLAELWDFIPGGPNED
jgi:hypothetical protein